MSSIPSLPLSFDTVLIANRGEIAVRFIRALHSINLRAVTVFVSDDATSPHIRLADDTHNLGSSYTLYNDISAMVAAAVTLKAGAVLPGYGFLSENADAARAFESAGIVWLGPTPSTIHLFGLKHTAREAAINAGVPVVPGSVPLPDGKAALQAAEKIGFPVLFKAAAGGGGMGQMIAYSQLDVVKAFNSVKNQADSLFGSSEVFIERYIQDARHVEVQVFGDGHGRVVAVGDRDCTMQRRRQKVFEEAPAPNLPEAVKKGLKEAAENLCGSVQYRSAGTVEFIVDAKRPSEWFFLEVNTRLQVEHGVTEMVSGVDLVRSMVLLGGCKNKSDVDTHVMDVLSSAEEHGACVEARVYAENPVNDYAPGAGTVCWMEWPDDADKLNTNGIEGTKLRVDRWAERGVKVSAHYDPMLGKVMVWGVTRALAIMGLKQALRQTKVRGVPSNLELLTDVLTHKKFLSASHTTRYLSTLKPRARAIQVITPGLQSSLQDYPGRIGYWAIGVSPSGPMDPYAMGMGNALVGNTVNKTALEMAVSGPSLKFHCDAYIALTGAAMTARVNMEGDGTEWHALPYWTPVHVSAGAVVEIGCGGNLGDVEYGKQRESIGGKTTYLSVRGGFDAPLYLGSASTFPTGKFGGITGSFLTAGDMLPLTNEEDSEIKSEEESGMLFRWPVGRRLDSIFIPSYEVPNSVWEVGALNGPHGSDDFLERETLEELWDYPYEVHHATNRLGARLIGPVPKWTRPDGGSAGLHPSNLHDYTYAPGTLNLSGNTPIVLMLDGPSLGGFVCPLTIATSELWKVAQAVPGDRVRFRPVSFDEARSAMTYMRAAWNAVYRFDVDGLAKLATKWNPWWIRQQTKILSQPTSAILATLTEMDFDVVYRMSGDEHVLVEYGEIEVDFAYRIRIQLLMKALEGCEFILELCPGVRSLLVRFNRDVIHIDDLIKVLTGLETSGKLGLVKDVELPSRLIELPLAFEDKWTVEAQARYMRSVRPDAPYMPSNIEFIRRINGLDSKDAVREIVTSAEYLVLGLGDVYLGAPCAVPVDPRHRLVTSKYNPARTYTPEGAVGIGGVFMCVYGMESPGGYQLTGRTLPIWDNFCTIPERQRGSPSHIPWLLRFFDRVKFFPVTDDQLKSMREAYQNGTYKIRITNETFSYKKHAKFLMENAQDIQAFESRRRAAYDEERVRWDEQGERASNAAARHANAKGTDRNEDDGSHGVACGKKNGANENSNVIAVRAGMSANVWSVNVQQGDQVEQGDQVLSLESMKVEMAVRAPIAGVIAKVNVRKSDKVQPDDVVIMLTVPDEDDENHSKSTIAEIRKRVELGLTNYSRELAKSVRRAQKLGFDISANIVNGGKDFGKEKQGGLFGVPFLALNEAPRSVVSALSDAGAELVGWVKRMSLEDTVGSGACIFGVGIRSNQEQSTTATITKGTREDVTTLWVSNGLLPTIRDGEHEHDSDGWSAACSVQLIGRCVADVDAVLRNSLLARKKTRAPHLLLPFAEDRKGQKWRQIRVGACKLDRSFKITKKLGRKYWQRFIDSQVWSEVDVLIIEHGDFDDLTPLVKVMVLSLGCCALTTRMFNGKISTLIGSGMYDKKVLEVANTDNMVLSDVLMADDSPVYQLVGSILDSLSGQNSQTKI